MSESMKRMFGWRRCPSGGSAQQYLYRLCALVRAEIRKVRLVRLEPDLVEPNRPAIAAPAANCSARCEGA